MFAGIFLNSRLMFQLSIPVIKMVILKLQIDLFTFNWRGVLILTSDTSRTASYFGHFQPQSIIWQSNVANAFECSLTRDAM